jgi:glutamate--cysteine ligase
MYDQTALDAAWDLVKGWDTETREALRVAAAEHGLHAQVGSINMRELSRQVLSICEAGLKARAQPGAGGLVPDETHFLNALQESVDSGQVPADELLERYHGDWQGDLNRIYAEYSY